MEAGKSHFSFITAFAFLPTQSHANPILCFAPSYSDRHVAVTVKDLDPLVASLEKHGRPYTFSKSGRRAVFTRDIDSNAIEFIEDQSA